MTTGSDAYARIYRTVRRIPRGRVATYGQIAALAGLPGHARQVGYALHATPDDLDLPWHRVINARGEVSPRSDGPYAAIQWQLLAEEGIVAGPGGRIDLARLQWRPRR